MTTGRSGEARPRGRPRSPDAEQQILRATMALLIEGGTDAATIDAIAARSGCAKSTVYRRWPSRDALLVDAMAAAVLGTEDHVRETQARERTAGTPIRGAAHDMLDLVHSQLFRAALPTIARELLEDSPIGERFRADVFRPIRAMMRDRLGEEVARGAIRADLDLDLVLDLVNGAVLYRALLGEPLDPAVADQIADMVSDAAQLRVP